MNLSSKWKKIWTNIWAFNKTTSKTKICSLLIVYLQEKQWLHLVIFINIETITQSNSKKIISITVNIQVVLMIHAAIKTKTTSWLWVMIWMHFYQKVLKNWKVSYGIAQSSQKIQCTIQHLRRNRKFMRECLQNASFWTGKLQVKVV